MKTDKKTIKPTLKLDAKQKKHFTLLCEWLEENKDLQNVDAFVLTLTVISYSQVEAALEDLTTNKPIQKFKNGVIQVSPYFTVYQKALSTFYQNVAQLGLSPKSRKFLVMKLESENLENDPLDIIGRA